ncbi:MAG: DUF4236 domain-containing protein [Gemmatimonadetes bacterium]|nr:DUF4236 domain-containing protein [Gemmatimonadota bacterium]
MGLFFRRSVNFGPLRVNFSTRGVGYSVGGRGFRTGVRANGRRYTRVSLPGTGIGYQQTHGKAGAGGCLLYAALLGGAVAAPWWMA